MRTLALLCVLACMAGCSTVQDWSSYIQKVVKEKVLITTGGTYTVKVLKWDGKEWVPLDYTIPDGYYILPPIEEIIGL